MKASFLALALFAVSNFGFQMAEAGVKFDSKYTSLEDKDCKLIDASDLHRNAEIDYFTSSCPGLDGYTVAYDGGDMRSWVGLIAPGQAHEDAASFYAPLTQGALGQFPNVQGDKLEWRYAGDKLVALIIRMTAQDIEDYEKDIETLVVVRVDTADLSKACLIGSVDVRKVSDSNVAARAIADDLTKPCL